MAGPAFKGGATFIFESCQCNLQLLYSILISSTTLSHTALQHAPQGGGSGCLQVGHSIFTSIHLCKHLLWKKWPHGVTIRAEWRCTSSGFMQITHSTPASPVSMSPCSLHKGSS